MIATSGAALLAMAGLASCSDDESEPVTQAVYDEAAEQLCDRHATEVDLDLDAFMSNARSDAERVAFFRTELVPRYRAIVRGLNRTGFPPERAAEYRAALTEVLEALSEIDDEDEAYEYLDHLRRGDIEEEEDPAARIDGALADADVPC
jgi:hypothetical protein